MKIETESRQGATIAFESNPWDARKAIARANLRPARISGTITVETSDPHEALRIAIEWNNDFTAFFDTSTIVTTIDDEDGYFTHTFEFPVPPSVTVMLQSNTIATPEALPNPDFTELIKVCKEYIEDMDNEDFHEDDDDQHYIFEAALEAVFGKDVWKWVNQVMK